MPSYFAKAILTALAVAGPVAGAFCPATPQNAAGKNITYLPDPFHFVNGAPVRNVVDWACRRQEIGNLFQQYELGTLPGRPQSLKVNYTAGTPATLNITVSQGGKSISFAPTITYPTSGKAPYPAVIAYGGPSIPIPAGVATITLDNSAIAQQNDQSSRGVGLFYDLYGSNATASSMLAWAWSVSRVIDALEQTPKANINLLKIGLTGCSRNGKGALVGGAFEPRIALTIPQESGSGGDACWRLSNAEQAAGFVVQTSSEIVQENVWFSEEFDNYANGTDVDLLPFDHHMLAGMVAPRALLAIENTAYVWLSPESSYGCMSAAKKIYQALDVPQNFGFTQDGNHSHCAFPADQQGDLDAFFNKFFFDEQTNTNIFKTTNETFPPGEKNWTPWSVPRLI